MLFDIFEYFQRQQHIIPSLPRRSTTRDVDYIHRSFVVEELALYDMPDAAVDCLILR